MYEYNFITSLDHVYGSDLSSGGYAGDNSDDRPELRKYYVGEFTRKMKLALHCITSQVRLYIYNPYLFTTVEFRGSYRFLSGMSGPVKRKVIFKILIEMHENILQSLAIFRRGSFLVYPCQLCYAQSCYEQ